MKAIRKLSIVTALLVVSVVTVYPQAKSTGVKKFTHFLATRQYWMGSKLITETVEVIHCDFEGDTCWTGEVVAVK
ncbi:hypothetical protein [Roseivirga sp.]|uniref:hypothetical protein n=1 Tax=Roseivirga sp. TaxID=1964215 RepID=UPI003B517C0E